MFVAERRRNTVVLSKDADRALRNADRNWLYRPAPLEDAAPLSA